MERLNALIDNLKINPPNYANPTSVKDWFLLNKIRVCKPQEGDTTSLWFCLADIARVIGDSFYRKYKSKYSHNVKMNDKNGRCQTYIMLTEQGIYRYLLRSNQPAAEPFQDWVCELLATIRQEVVTKAERDIALLTHSIAIRDDNFKVLINADNRRMDYGLLTQQDTTIIERCYLHGVDCTQFTDRQLQRLRAELHCNEPTIVDELLTEWKLIPVK